MLQPATQPIAARNDEERRLPVAALVAIHLIADDLTGALDTAAQFVAVTGAIPVHWQGASAAPTAGSIALDSGTREAARDVARARVAALVASLPVQRNAITYAKLDSLLRGHAAAELAGWLAALAPAHCIIAPAFPFQGRVMRGGCQHVRTADGWQPVAGDLRAELQREGLSVRRCLPGDPVPAGVSLWDTETDDDLATIAAAGCTLSRPVLWCGSGGLAAAIAGRLAPAAAGLPAPPMTLPRPVLGLFGSDHPVTAGQIAACGPLAVALPDGGSRSAGLLSRRLQQQAVVLARLALPEGLGRDEAARHIDREFGALVRRMDPPATLLVAGGETLRSLCIALQADHLELDGQMLPGVPCSVVRGGRFDGVRVVSKSGAFGDPRLLSRLLTPSPALQGDSA